MPTPIKSFRSGSPLEPAEIKLLIEEGAKLFSYLELTPAARQYLDDHPRLAQVIDKW